MLKSELQLQVFFGFWINFKKNKKLKKQNKRYLHNR
jgi:hypothetical protein